MRESLLYVSFSPAVLVQEADDVQTPLLDGNTHQVIVCVLLEVIQAVLV